MGSYPPPFSPPAPRKDNTLKIVLIILGVAAFMCVLLLGAAGVFGMKFFNQSIKPLAGCAIGFNDVREAMREYAKEHNDTLPAADKWQDEIRPYLVKVLAKNREDKGGIFPELDPNGNWGCDDGKGGRDVLEFADVPRPVVARQQRRGAAVAAGLHLLSRVDAATLGAVEVKEVAHAGSIDLNRSAERASVTRSSLS